ncbi:hypothetical protein SDJN02_13221, partial [Cucurbita argyrosperma subsp. argyrosperma]
MTFVVINAYSLQEITTLNVSAVVQAAPEFRHRERDVKLVAKAQMAGRYDIEISKTSRIGILKDEDGYYKMASLIKRIVHCRHEGS